jgi:GNAT superfamily N-acetyltransferase
MNADVVRGKGLMDRLRLTEGTLADYRALAGFHYLSNAPVTATRIWRFVDVSPSVWQRWRAMRGEPTEANGPRVAAVLVVSLPALSCAMRDAALPGRYTGMNRRSAARLINDELRCISRVVVHPQYRGLGLAVRLVQHALKTAETPYTEALAAMGRVHPFFKRAGMSEYQRPPHAKDQRLLDATRSVGIAPWELASREHLLARLGETSRGDVDLFQQALQRWAGRSLSFEEQLDLARRKLLTEPRYYLRARSG